MVLHPFHLVTLRPWPIVSGALVWSRMVRFWAYCWGGGGVESFLFRLAGLIVAVGLWWGDVTKESTEEGCHTPVVEANMRWGFILFIVREVLLFFRVFWGFWHCRLRVGMEWGDSWPSIGSSKVNAFDIPLLNTIILLGSGVRVTWAHHSIIEGSWRNIMWGVVLTILIGVYFLMIQGGEYYVRENGIWDRATWRCFYTATGLHGCHVVVGALYLLVIRIRMVKGHFRTTHHFGFEGRIWYWHFVDVVWLLLFVEVYWWGM